MRHDCVRGLAWNGSLRCQKIISTNAPMKYRYLRILWTAFCGIACVLLIALWGKSLSIDGHIITFGDPVPLFLLAVLFAGLAYLPWNQLFWRFSLSDILFVTAVIALVLFVVF